MVMFENLKLYCAADCSDNIQLDGNIIIISY